MKQETRHQFSRNRKIADCCPCGKSNRDGKFAPFIGYRDKGYCHSCQKLFAPNTRAGWKPLQDSIRNSRLSSDAEMWYINKAWVNKSFRLNEFNNLIYFLSKSFGNDKVTNVIEKYRVGTSCKIPGAAIFWYIDQYQNVRSGKVMNYNSETGKRLKKGTNNIRWVHELSNIEGFRYSSCLFGEHLLINYPTKPIAVVESEKTALICSIFDESHLWMATGGISNFNQKNISVLRGRDIIAFPDLGAYEHWCKKAATVDFSIEVSRLLEDRATIEERNEKLDVADLLIKDLA